MHLLQKMPPEAMEKAVVAAVVAAEVVDAEIVAIVGNVMISNRRLQKVCKTRRAVVALNHKRLANPESVSIATRTRHSCRARATGWSNQPQ